MYKMSKQELIQNVYEWEKSAEYSKPIITRSYISDGYDVRWIGHGRIRITERRYLLSDRIIYETPPLTSERKIELLERELDKNNYSSLTWRIDFHKRALKHEINEVRKIIKQLDEMSEWGVECNHCHSRYRQGEYEATEWDLFICPNCNANDEDAIEIRVPKGEYHGKK